MPGLTGSALRAVAFNALYADSGFPLLAELMRAALTGDPLPGLPTPPPGQFRNLIAVQTATACNDTTWPRSVRGYAGAVARDRIAHPLTAGMPVNIFPCAFWPYRPAEPQCLRRPRRDRVPRTRAPGRTTTCSAAEHLHHGRTRRAAGSHDLVTDRATCV